MATLLLAVVLVSMSARATEDPKPFFLPKSPVAAAYVLGRLSNQELIEAPRSEFVFLALLQRNGLERKYRFEALEGLAGLRKTTLLGEIVQGISELDRKGEGAEPALRDLAAMLLQSKPADLAGQHGGLEKLAIELENGFGTPGGERRLGGRRGLV